MSGMHASISSVLVLKFTPVIMGYNGCFLLAQSTFYLALRLSFGPDGTVNYDYIVTNSIKSMLIGSKCITNGAHTNHC